jgi:hypothetical protein
MSTMRHEPANKMQAWPGPASERATVNKHKVGSTAFDLGQTAIERVEEACAQEKLRREKLNSAEIAGLRVRLTHLSERRSELRKVDTLTLPSDLENLRRKRWCARFLALFFAACGVFFAHLALAPFGLGWEAWLFSFGLGIVGFLSTDRFLATFESRQILKTLVAVSFVASIAGLLILAFLRGEVVALYLKQAVIGASIDMPTIGQADPAESFYEKSVPWLQLFMAFLAVAMELTAGMTLYESRKLDPGACERAERARLELREIDEELVESQKRITFLQNEPEIYEAEFMRDLRAGVVSRLNGNGTAKVIILLTLLCGFGGRANDTYAEPINVVIGIDLSQSAAAVGYDRKSEFQKNLEAAEALLLSLPQGCRFSVVAITDHSFSQGNTVISGQVPEGKGPLTFLDPAAQAKRRAAAQLRHLQTLEPRFGRTDILGVLVLAADLLKQYQGQKVLVLFSDLRQNTPEIDLQNSPYVATTGTMANIEQQKLLADLASVDIYALGVHGAGKSVAYWESLRSFWSAYFGRAGAVLKTYSPNRYRIALEAAGGQL